jgi:hypothetical protein
MQEVNTMNRNLETFDTDVTLSLNDAPLPLRAPVGAAIFAMRGDVWITQERLSDDIVLAPGERFDVKSTELIIASAIKDTATIHVVPPAAARTHHHHQDIYEFVRARAKQLRGEEIARIGSLAASAVSTFLVRARASRAPTACHGALRLEYTEGYFDRPSRRYCAM